MSALDRFIRWITAHPYWLFGLGLLTIAGFALALFQPFPSNDSGPSTTTAPVSGETGPTGPEEIVDSSTTTSTEQTTTTTLPEIPCVENGTAATKPPFEPNDGHQHPAGPILDSDLYRAETETANDADWYAFCLHQRTQVKVQVSNRTNDCNNLYSELHSDNEYLAGVNPREGDTEEMAQTLAAGRYALFVSSNAGFTCPGARYAFRIIAPEGALVGSIQP